MVNAELIGPAGSSDTPLPFFSFRVPAGFPSPAQDHMERQISLDEALDIRAPHTYLVRAIGDSMTGVGIYDGDILAVNRSLRPASGQVVIAVLNGEPLKKLFMVQAGQSRCWRLALGRNRPMLSRGFSFS
ncbi:LexA family protein [Azotobacter bryophylli]|uniref:LexA family protein n=1 Tax=Azotobacter bryophylli TaxID=1986537 RepID=A0ABV7AYQ0_9GAMM